MSLYVRFDKTQDAEYFNSEDAKTLHVLAGLMKGFGCRVQADRQSDATVHLGLFRP